MYKILKYLEVVGLCEMPVLLFLQLCGNIDQHRTLNVKELFGLPELIASEMEIGEAFGFIIFMLGS